MSPGKQLLMDGFPAPRRYMEGVRKLHIGMRLTVIFFDQDVLTGAGEIAEIENLYYAGFDANDEKLSLHFQAIK